jgi:hypothetical protein
MHRVSRLDLSGEKFGRWVVVGQSHKNASGEVFWLCRCECGGEKSVKAGSLRSGRSTSCGCAHLDAVTSHGMTKTPTFKSWESMKQRCLNQKAPDYHSYGGRGIKVHEAWRDSFPQFLADMGERPEGTTLDRIDVDGDYEPSNCRWATLKTQQRNRRVTSAITHNGATRSLAEWAELTGVPSKILGWRIKVGWDTASALTTPALGRGGKR